MKYYIQFYTGENNEALGSDGVFILDGRNSTYNMINDGRDRAWQLRNIKKFYGFKIMRGERFKDSNPYTNLIKLKNFSTHCAIETPINLYA